MNTAKNRQQYIKVWNNHITEFSELGKVFWEKDDDALYNEVQAIRRRLKELVDTAADLEFGENNYFGE